MNAPIETRHLRAFLVLAEELHFGAAAERLGMSQPPFSQQIRRLEQQLGVRLFERTTRSVRLTEAGELFLRKARFAMSQIDDGVRLARLAAAGAMDHLSVGFIQPAMYRAMPRALQAFTDLYPGVALELRHLSSPEQVKALLEGQLDVGLIRPPVGMTELSIEVIAREGFAVALRSDHPLSRQRSVSLASLAEERFIHFRSSTGDTFPQQVPTYCRHAGFEPRFVCETTTTAATLALVGIGAAIAILPRWTRHIAPVNVVLRPVPEIPAIVELAAAWVVQTPSDSVRNFLAILCNQRVAAGCMDQSSSTSTARVGKPKQAVPPA